MSGRGKRCLLKLVRGSAVTLYLKTALSSPFPSQKKSSGFFFFS